MLGSIRTGVAAGIAVLVGIAGLSYVLAASAAPPGGTTAAVEVTPDGKLKRPEGATSRRSRRILKDLVLLAESLSPLCICTEPVAQRSEVMG